MTNLLLIMTVIYLSCLFNHAVLWIEQSPWERRRLPRVKLLAQSCGRAARSRPVAPAPCGLNKLGFIRVSRKAEFLETSHFPSSASNLFLSLRATWSGHAGQSCVVTAVTREPRPPPQAGLRSRRGSATCRGRILSPVQRFHRTWPARTPAPSPTSHWFL